MVLPFPVCPDAFAVAVTAEVPPTPARWLEPETALPAEGWGEAEIHATPLGRVVRWRGFGIRLVEPDGTDHLRVLFANERKDRLALVAPIVVRSVMR